MKRGAYLLLIGLFGLSLSSFAQTLKQDIDRLIDKNVPTNSEVGLAIYDLTDHKVLYHSRAEKLSHPASTMKLLTSITALSKTPVDEPFTTEVWYTGKIANDTLKGDLYVVGGYDPEFDEKAMDYLVNKVASCPFSVIQGTIYGDVSVKDSLYWGRGWYWDDTPEAYQPYLSPLMYCKGVVSVEAKPGKKDGAKASLKCYPKSSYYKVKNKTQTHQSSAGAFSIDRPWMENKNVILVKGNIKETCKGSINVYSSQDFFMTSFVEKLRQKKKKIPVSYAFGKLNRHNALSQKIASWETSLPAVLKVLLKESDNLNAEAVLHRIGKYAIKDKTERPVSATDGITVVQNLLKGFGHSSEEYRMADGSGLSNYNYVSPVLLLDVLLYAYDEPQIFKVLYESLPISGVDGSLENRMKKGSPAYNKVHAKTGSYTGINCLAGYLKSGEGHDIAFSIMNQNVLDASKARAFQDKVCELLCKGK